MTSSSANSDALHLARMQRMIDAENASASGMRHMYMHWSALSPTTRKSHAERHGKLFTAEQVREFWSIPENIVGCKCTILAVLVDRDNQPVIPDFIDNARETYKKMHARGYDWSK